MMRNKKALVFLCLVLAVSALREECGAGAVSVFSLLSGTAAGHTEEGLSHSLLLFRSDRDGDFELYTIRGDGTNLTQLTFNAAKDSRAKFSPDYTKIVFVRNDESIYVMDADGSNEQFIMQGKWADFTPDGGGLVVSAYGGSVYAAENLFVYDLSTQSLTPLVGRTGSELAPDVTASGKIAYFHYFYFDVYYRNVWTINLDGSQDTQLTSYYDWEQEHAENPRFSPDETQIVYQNTDGGSGIWVMNADGSGKLRIASSLGGGAITPVWSPFGDHILYADWVGNQSKIYIVHPDGSGREVFYEAPGNNYPMDWVTPSVLKFEDLPSSVVIEQGGEGSFSFTISRIGEGEAVDWAVRADEACPWIQSIVPDSGRSVTPEDHTVVTVTIDAQSMTVGEYAASLVIDEGDYLSRINVPVTVYNRADMEELSLLSACWTRGSLDAVPFCEEADWFADGAIDFLDLQQLALNWLETEVLRVYPAVREGFESGGFTTLEWQSAGNAAWTVSSGDAFEGSHAAQSGDIGSNQTSILKLVLDLPSFNTIRFARRVSSESTYDPLIFSIDGVEQGRWSGERAWAEVSFSFAPGVHTFSWMYKKDGSLNRGSDCAWIDEIEIYFQE